MGMIKRGLALIFQRRDFGLLMGVQFLAQAGDGLFQTAVAKAVAKLDRERMEREAEVFIAALARDGVIAGVDWVTENPKEAQKLLVQHTEREPDLAGQIAGRTGNVTRLDDPAAAEWVVVRFGTGVA